MAALFGGVFTVISPASAASAIRLNATQASKVQFALTYLRYHGHPLTTAQAISLVEEDGSKVPTMAEAPAWGFVAKPAADGVAVVNMMAQPVASVDSPQIGAGCLSGQGWVWKDANADAVTLQWFQFISWCWVSPNTVYDYSTNGYPWVAAWAREIWHYGGPVVGDGYPGWYKGYDCGGYLYERYMFIETFVAGIGPYGYVTQWNMWIEGDASGGGAGGTF